MLNMPNKMFKLAIFLLLLFSVISAYYEPLDKQKRDNVPYNYSLRSITSIADFPYTSCNDIPNTYNNNCGNFIDDMNFVYRSPITGYIEIYLSPEEQQIFRNEINSLKSSDQKLSEMKSLWFIKIRDIDENCSIFEMFSPIKFQTFILKNGKSITLPIVKPVDFEASNCKVNAIGGFLSDILQGLTGEYDKAISHQHDSFNSAANALNTLVRDVAMQSDSLYYEGAGYSNYSTSAYVYYNEIKSILANKSTDPRFSSYFAIANASAKLNTNSRFINNEMSIMNSQDYVNAFTFFVDLYRNITEERAKLATSYTSTEVLAEQVCSDAETKLKYLIDNKYYLINQQVVMQLNISQTTSLDFETKIPSSNIDSIKELVYGSGSFTGGKTLIDNAKQDFSKRVLFFYSTGIEKFSKAILQCNQSLFLSEKTEEQVDSILDQYDSLVKYKLDVASKALSDYKVYDEQTAAVSSLLNEKYKNASEIYYNYNPANTTKGERVFQLYTAVLLLNDVYNGSQMKASDLLVEKKSQLKKSLEKLNETIKKAKQDEIDVYDAEQLLKTKSELLMYQNINISYYDSSIQEVNSMVDAIYTAAETKYYYLSDQREKLYHTLNSLSSYIDVSSYRQNMQQYEKYISGNNFDKIKTLGSYLVVKKAYDSIESDMNKNSVSILSYYLSKTSAAYTSFNSSLIVDKYAYIRTYVEIRNDLYLSASSPVKVTLTNIPIGENIKVDSEQPGVYVIKEGDNVVVSLPNVSERKSYVLTLSSLTKPVSSTRNMSRVSLSETQLIESLTYSLNSQFDIDSIRLEEDYSADQCFAKMDGRTQEILSSSNLTIMLTNLKKGKSTLSVTCITYKPLEVRSLNYTTSENKVSYSFGIKSNTGTLNDFYYVLEIGPAAEIISDTIKIYDPDGKIADKFQFYKSGDKYYAKWFISVLPEDYIYYTVEYSTTDIVSYYSKIKQEVENLSNSEGVDVTNYINNAKYYANRGNYNSAIDQLDKAKKQISNIQMQKIENASLNERLNKINLYLSDLKNKSNQIYNLSTTLSLPSISTEIAKQIAGFDSDITQAKAYMDRGDIQNAKSIISKLEKTLSSSSISNPIYDKQSRLQKELYSLVSKIRNIEKFTDTSSLSEMINEINSKLMLVAPAVDSQDYYTALSNLQEAGSIKDKLEKEFENKSANISIIFDSKLKNAKSVLDMWKKQKSSLTHSLTIDKDSPIKSDQQAILNLINETDDAVNSLNYLYQKMNKYSFDEKISNIQELYEIDNLTQVSSNKLAYLSQLVERYKQSSAERIKDVSTMMQQKLESGSSEEKKKVQELQPILASAKEYYNNGRYLNSLVLTDYLRSNLLAPSPVEQALDLSIIAYAVLVLVSIAVLLSIFYSKKPPKEEKRLEKLKLD